MTAQDVFKPHVPGHGSVHFCSMHALFEGHSELTTHSGLQLGGLPIYVGAQEQTAWSFTSLHWLFGPQGEGRQGFIGSLVFIARITFMLRCWLWLRFRLRSYSCGIHILNGSPE